MFEDVPPVVPDAVQDRREAREVDHTVADRHERAAPDRLGIRQIGGAHLGENRTTRILYMDVADA